MSSHQFLLILLFAACFFFAQVVVWVGVGMLMGWI